MFVVVTLTVNKDRDRAQAGQRIYMTPTVFGLGSVLVLSAFTAIPGLGVRETGLAVAALGAAGLVYAGLVLAQFTSRKAPEPPHWSDLWCYGAAPVLIYVALLAAAGLVVARVGWAAYAMAGVLMAQLLLAVRNAWDLITWLAPDASEKS